jgi:ankyrin repeat protein
MNQAWQAATRQGDVEQVRHLLETGADINARDRYGQTALMNAARKGQVELVRLLVERGAALNTTAKYNLTALMLAIINGHTEIAHILIQVGADGSIRGTGAPGFYNKTACMLAEERGQRKVVEWLKAAGVTE